MRAILYLTYVDINKPYIRPLHCPYVSVYLGKKSFETWQKPHTNANSFQTTYID